MISFDCFPLFAHALMSLIKFMLWLKFFHRQREAEEMGVEGRDHSVLIHYMDYVEHRMLVGEVEAGRPTRKLMQQSK